MDWIRQKTQNASSKFSRWKEEKFGKSSLRKSIEQGGSSSATSGRNQTTFDRFKSEPLGNLIPTRNDGFMSSNAYEQRDKAALKRNPNAISSEDYFFNDSGGLGRLSIKDRKSSGRVELKSSAKKKKTKKKKKKKKAKRYESDSDESDSSEDTTDSSSSDDSEEEARRKRRKKRKKKKKLALPSDNSSNTDSDSDDEAARRKAKKKRKKKKKKKKEKAEREQQRIYRASTAPQTWSSYQ
ncbi:hypothetical protein AAMO2058_001531300 [Amorphochlora amoebiformis]|uniref:Uncharacterized protein n=1 Tax=Amorphochlora amoebiformis TaxID=1561963 RepID=A0A7S0DGT3_9EUKA|mmetsp:Transcript_27243/g.43245  ORF Transcript_27243/g.43245 Transcript_27243/m.43245 type:complete len:239 (+) Transcript_27243:134-850(+)